MTINEAAAQLGVSRTMIRNLINAGDLKEFKYVSPPPRNAGRVYRSSIEAYERKRAADGRREQPRWSKADAEDRVDERISRREARANAAAQELKVAADLARQQSREIRKEASRVAAKLSRVIIQQAEMIARLKADAAVESEHTEQVLDAYSNALTQLLAPDDIRPL
ncbi:helix-turn-helix domain-containing protein [Mycobacteroides chelonae]|uniref:helix-turn-helix domain-containing protein n=1 Tax=Mycobacteroides chelonae TaxID=1774 RepID=UPI0018B0F09C|nr:helix-turn-helix domain-containing protein [Mycobacteroides chelonae]